MFEREKGLTQLTKLHFLSNPLNHENIEWKGSQIKSKGNCYWFDITEVLELEIIHNTYNEKKKKGFNVLNLI